MNARQLDVELFDGARIEYLVFEEAQTFKGAAGAETAYLIDPVAQGKPGCRLAERPGKKGGP